MFNIKISDVKPTFDKGGALYPNHNAQSVVLLMLWVMVPSGYVVILYVADNLSKLGTPGNLLMIRIAPIVPIVVEDPPCLMDVLGGVDVANNGRNIR